LDQALVDSGKEEREETEKSFTSPLICSFFAISIFLHCKMGEKRRRKKKTKTTTMEALFDGCMFPLFPVRVLNIFFSQHPLP
jgi:hypothetical protein